MRHGLRSAQGRADRDVASRRGVRESPAHRRYRDMAAGVGPRCGGCRAQRSNRVLRGAVAAWRAAGLMSGDVVGSHNELHSAEGARKGEHPGRSRDPIIKVHNIAWLEFEKPDLTRAEAFSCAFGLSTAMRTAHGL